MPPSPKPNFVWFFSPVYLDVESFLILRQRILERPLALRGATPRFVIIDDTAGLDEQIRELAAFGDVRVLVPPFNLGHQRAIVYGLRTLADEIAEEDLIVTLDADGEDRPEDLPRLLAALEAPGARGLRQIVLAQRTKRRESPTFKVMYFFFKLFFRFLTGTVIRTGNFAAFRGWAARNVLFHPHFDLCYSSSWLSLNLPVTPVPCERGRRYAGRSRMNLVRLITHGIRMLMPFLDRIAIRALIGFSVTLGGATALALGLLARNLVAGQPLAEALSGRLGWALLTCGGLSFLALGNFVILFTLFSQSQGFSLRALDQRRERGDAKAA
ncbi:MAG: glycosyltransferase [Oligoflexia bacterium]|nr:glycosyltransferase [Oligoflexia bacterium]